MISLTFEIQIHFFILDLFDILVRCSSFLLNIVFASDILNNDVIYYIFQMNEG